MDIQGDTISQLVDKFVNRFGSRVLRRGFLGSEYFRYYVSDVERSDANEVNPLLGNFEAEIRSHAEAAACEHCKYMAKSLTEPGLGWRVKLDYSLLQTCTASCSLCKFIFEFIQQDKKFLEVVKESSTALRIVSNIAGTIVDRGIDSSTKPLQLKSDLVGSFVNRVASNEGEIPRQATGLYPQLTVTSAPNLAFKNVTFGIGGLEWPIHEDGILPFEGINPVTPIERPFFTGRLVMEETDCDLLLSWLHICRNNHGSYCEPNPLTPSSKL